jgi:iron(III) transport system substrate-binding protein
MRAAVVFSTLLFACTACSHRHVVVYVATDREIAEPVLQAFERSSGIRVDAVYDTEANKTSGLVNRLIAEAQRPRADVFWDNETAQLTRLSDAGVVGTRPLPQGSAAREPSRNARAAQESAVPPVESGGPTAPGVNGRSWAGFAARARVLVVYTGAGSKGATPDSIEALTEPAWKGRAALANPHFGTTGTHFAALLLLWGEPQFRHWLRQLRENEVAILPGNAQVKDAVSAGRYDFGFSDTDDVNEALRDGKPVRLVVPDQGVTEMGVLIIPNAVALIRGAPHPESGSKLMSYLLSPEVEAALGKGAGAQIPIRNAVPGPALLPPLSSLKAMKVDYEQVGHGYVAMLRIVDEEWPR